MRTEWASLSVCVGGRCGAGWCGRPRLCKGPQREWGSKGLHLARIELATFSVLG